MNEFDANLAVVNMYDALQLMHQAGPDGLSIKTNDAMNAPFLSRQAAMGLHGQFGIIDWTQRNRKRRNW